MTTPRSREEIEKEAYDKVLDSGFSVPVSQAAAQWVIAFTLLDIRDLLTKKNPTDV